MFENTRQQEIIGHDMFETSVHVFHVSINGSKFSFSVTNQEPANFLKVKVLKREVKGRESE